MKDSKLAHHNFLEDDTVDLVTTRNKVMTTTGQPDLLHLATLLKSVLFAGE